MRSVGPVPDSDTAVQATTATAVTAAPARLPDMVAAGFGGNRALAALMGGRRADEPPAAASGMRSPALDDPNFNASSRAHDLVRAVDSSAHTYRTKGFWDSGEDVAAERRAIDFPAAVTALDGLTKSQVAEVERLFEEFDHTKLRDDLFAGGESGRQADLTADQKDRLTALLGGTKPEPLPPAMAIMTGLAQDEAVSQQKQSAVESALHHRESEAIELHTLLAAKLSDAGREQLMTTFRRGKDEVAALSAGYDTKYGPDALALDLDKRLEGLQRRRMAALQSGDVARADAYAIEDKRRDIAELTKSEGDLYGSVGEVAKLEIERKKRDLTAGIQSIVDLNKQEALTDKAYAGRSAGDAVAARLGQVMGQQVGDGRLGAQLATTLSAKDSAAIGELTNPWTGTAGSTNLIQAAAAQLAADEKNHTTSSERLIATMQSFRKIAERDLLTEVSAPGTSTQRREEVARDQQGSITRLAQKYLDDYQAAYDRLAGDDGRKFEEILASASGGNEAYMKALMSGGGRTSELGELDRAMRNGSVEGVKTVLRGLPDGDAIRALTVRYNGLGNDRDFRRELFGVTRDLDGIDLSSPIAQAQAMMAPTRTATPKEASGDNGLAVLGAMARGRDAAQLGELLGRPGAGATMGDEASWVAAGGRAEFQATMDNRGLTGRLREVDGSPETQRLLEQTDARLAELKLEFDAEPDEYRRKRLVAEMHQLRATLTGDAAAYEKDNARVLAQIQSALSFAVSIALAIAIPGAGAGLAALLQTTAINIAATVASNFVIKMGDYSLADLRNDVLGGVLGVAGGKLGEAALGQVTKIAVRAAAQETSQAAAGLGIKTVLGREAAAVAGSGEKVIIEAAELEAGVAGHAAATESSQLAAAEGTQAAAKEGAASAQAAAKKGATSAQAAAEEGATSAQAAAKESAAGAQTVSKEVAEDAAKQVAAQEAGAAAKKAGDEAVKKWAVVIGGAGEIGNFFGSYFGAQAATGDFHVSMEELLKAFLVTMAGKAAHAQRQGKQAPEPETGEQAMKELKETLAEYEATKPAEEPSVFIELPAGPAPRTQGEMLLGNGIPPDSAKGFQQVADTFNVIIKVRPTNTASLPVLEAGGLAKPSAIKAKTVNRVDLEIGGPPDGIGKVGMFEPRMPSEQRLSEMNPAERAAVTERYGKRLEEYQGFAEDYKALLAGDPLVQAKDGVLQLKDPRTGEFHDIGGDHDIYEIVAADGSRLDDDLRRFVVDQMQTMGINVEHPDHVNWETDSKKTFNKKEFERIRDLHTTEEALVAFVPDQAPREVMAGVPVTAGPNRKAPRGTITERTPAGPSAPGETDFSDVMPRETAGSKAVEPAPVPMIEGNRVAAIENIPVSPAAHQLAEKLLPLLDGWAGKEPAVRATEVARAAWEQLTGTAMPELAIKSVPQLKSVFNRKLWLIAIGHEGLYQSEITLETFAAVCDSAVHEIDHALGRFRWARLRTRELISGTFDELRRLQATDPAEAQKYLADAAKYMSDQLGIPADVAAAAVVAEAMPEAGTEAMTVNDDAYRQAEELATGPDDAARNEIYKRLGLAKKALDAAEAAHEENPSPENERAYQDRLREATEAEKVYLALDDEVRAFAAGDEARAAVLGRGRRQQEIAAVKDRIARREAKAAGLSRSGAPEELLASLAANMAEDRVYLERLQAELAALTAKPAP